MQNFKESDPFEVKELFSDKITKEIVSFLNANGGTIIIGVKDDGTIVGVENIDEVQKRISDIITNQIEPSPLGIVSTEVKSEEGKDLVFVQIQKGTSPIYCQKKYGFSSAGCSIRLGSTCKEMTSTEIQRRSLKTFHDLELILVRRSTWTNLSFRQLKIHLDANGIHINDDTFEHNYSLRNTNGDYNLLAELLADKNPIPLIFVKFAGLDKAAFSERTDYGYSCLLSTYINLKNRLKAENICITDTSVRPRIDTYLYDFDCVNEALINALIHNDWTISEPQISLFENRIEILSHGGLPHGLTTEDFYAGISKPRNHTLMRIFLSVGLAEHSDHGIPTIVNTYGKEVFQIHDNYIKCVIPFNQEVMNKTTSKHIIISGDNVPDTTVHLTATEKQILSLLEEDQTSTIDNLSQKVNKTTRTVERSLKNLQDKQKIERVGSKRSGFWVISKRHYEH